MLGFKVLVGLLGALLWLIVLVGSGFSLIAVSFGLLAVLIFTGNGARA